MAGAKEVRAALRRVVDPELGVNVVDLGLIYEVAVAGGVARVRMTLTAPGCPLGATLVRAVEEAARSVPGVERAEVEVVWSPPWTPDRMSERAREELGI